jgi:hypothetical protein
MRRPVLGVAAQPETSQKRAATFRHEQIEAVHAQVVTWAGSTAQ